MIRHVKKKIKKKNMDNITNLLRLESCNHVLYPFLFYRLFFFIFFFMSTSSKKFRIYT